MRHKFSPLADALTKHIVDVMFIQETKLDASFPEAQFDVPNYKSYRNDYKDNSGGIICYVRDDIAHRCRPELEVNTNNTGIIENIMIEKH